MTDAELDDLESRIKTLYTEIRHTRKALVFMREAVQEAALTDGAFRIAMSALLLTPHPLTDAEIEHAQQLASILLTPKRQATP